jgi:hypothetical protein
MLHKLHVGQEEPTNIPVQRKSFFFVIIVIIILE